MVRYQSSLVVNLVLTFRGTPPTDHSALIRNGRTFFMESIIEGEKKLWMMAESLRDRFAMAALTGLTMSTPAVDFDCEYIANLSYSLADEMIKRRGRE